MTTETKPPLWVSLALANIETRKGATLLLRAAVAATALSVPLSFWLDDWSWAAFMLPVPVWYWLSLRWMDRNGAWA